ncbi:MAG: hypothetical protein FWC62_03335 [Firmicutes bacterium]|nr:hypothetical protein [Bacillota bacterium]
MRSENVLEALYYGNIAPFESRFDRNPAYMNAAKTLCDREEQLTASLNAEEQQIFAQLVDAQCELSDVSGLEYFTEGFRLGAQFTLAAF